MHREQGVSKVTILLVVAGDAGTPEDDEAGTIDLEAAARDVWEDGLRLADLAAEAPQNTRFQIQEGLLGALQAYIAGLTSEQAQVCARLWPLLYYTQLLAWHC
jgi:hypothetical protein